MHTYREQEGRVLGTRMELRKRRRADTSRVIRVAISSALTALLVVGYAVGDLTDVFPGVLTLHDIANPSYAAPLSARTATAIAGTANRSKTVDAAAAQQLIDAFAVDPSVGTDFSIVIATADGTVDASHEPDAQREPASQRSRRIGDTGEGNGGIVETAWNNVGCRALRRHGVRRSEVSGNYRAE